MGRDSSHSPRTADPLRIALVAPPYFDVPPSAYGGVEAVVADLADALVARGHRVTLVGAGRDGTAARFVPVWDRTVPERLGEPFPEVMHALATRRAVEDLIRTEGLDVVHDHTLSGPLNAAGYAAAGVPTVVTVHGPVDDDLGRLYRGLGQDVHLVAISDRQRELAPDLNWTATVHNALRLADWPFQRQKEDYALFLGRFHPQKAPHLALEAAHAAGLPLVLAGKCAEPIEKEYFEREVRPRLTERDHVFGVADATAKRELLRKARCLLFPIRWEEPFGMVMIEAMACGTPVVALRAGAVPEVVAHGVTGLVCDDPGELPRALADVRDLDPDACRAHVAAHFDVDNLAAGYEAAFRKAVQAHRMSPAGSLDLLRRDYAALDSALDDTALDHTGLDHTGLEAASGDRA
ncbi:glycosyltransferase family 4 protein [Saccharothrix coeruleofusca]|uniref:Glycosyl transferase n=1 Tax=Saccharothrix coeruleofusca TaxID=33919 RepID=A0A918AV22_9PSEU|nr:glycosyltransferase family 4 protein [Saccharothrix coeruleofusca]GGP80863.1 glycosyl transferase [Saccharothrix coeruleofusca]